MRSNVHHYHNLSSGFQFFISVPVVVTQFSILQKKISFTIFCRIFTDFNIIVIKIEKEINATDICRIGLLLFTFYTRQIVVVHRQFL